MSMRGGSRGNLPTISNPQMTYGQRYEHMTKLANYAELTETQIWKEYEKLRACLKELNEEVLHHMEKKAYASLAKAEKPSSSKDSEGTLLLLQDEKRANETRMNTYTNELARFEQRIKYLAARPNLLQQLTNQGQQLQSKIKLVKRESKDLRRNQKMQGRDLVGGNSILEKLAVEEQRLGHVMKGHRKHQDHLRVVQEKIEKFKEKNSQLQKAIDLRVEQFSQGQNYVQEQIHFERYEELKKQREVIGKYEPVYKRNYLMKLKELDSLVSSIAKQDKIIQETQANVITVRQEIETITQMVSQQPRKRYNSTTTSKKQHQSMSMTPRVEAEQSVLLPPAPTTRNDKNRPEEL